MNNENSWPYSNVFVEKGNYNFIIKTPNYDENFKTKNVI